MVFAALFVIVTSLFARVVVGPHLPSRQAIGNKRVALTNEHQTIPATKLHTLLCSEADPLNVPGGCLNKAPYELRQSALGISAIRPERKVRGIC